MSLEPGTRLGPYEIVAPLGAGGMGEVYRAKDTRLGRDVAVKVLPQHLSSNPEIRARFEREAKTVSALNHPNICVLHDVGRQGDVDYLVMELIEGETLAQRLSRGALPVPDVLRLGAQIADALGRAHRAGVMHRDLKPGNVMLTKSGVKLLDFGLAKAVAPTSSPSGLTSLPTMAGSVPLTQEGTILGTFQYMAPEQLEGKEADGRTDIFAFGAVLYEMATGRKAFSGASQASLISSIMSSEPPAISAIQPMTPPALDRVVRTCLAKDPEDRWQTAHDLESELKWIAQVGSQAGVAAPVVARRRNRERLAWTAFAVAALAAVLFAAGYLRRAPHPLPAIQSTLPLPDQTILGELAVSPDGTRLAVTASLPGAQPFLWVRRLDGSSSERLTGTENAFFPFWSPDGRFLAFFADGKLKRVDASGGPVLTICDAERGVGGTWNRDGTIVFAPAPTSALFRVSAAGGGPVPVTKLDASRNETAHRYPVFLPDGRHFLYMAAKVSAPQEDPANWIRVGSLDGKEDRAVVNIGSNFQYASGHLLYVKSGTLLARRFDPKRLDTQGEPVPVAQKLGLYGWQFFWPFSVSENGVLIAGPTFATPSRLLWMDRDGKQIGVLGESGLIQSARLSPDGRRVAVVIADSGRDTSEIWIDDIATGAGTKFAFSSAHENGPVWSPDGTRLAFSSDRKAPSARNDVWLKSLDGSREHVLSESADDRHPEDWSPDGRYVSVGLIQARGNRNNQLWILDTREQKLLPFETEARFSAASRFSPDGRWLAYASDESGRFEIYVRAFPGPGGKWQVSTAGGGYPVWSRDGKELFYLTLDNRVASVRVSSSGASFSAGPPALLFALHPAAYPGPAPFDVSPDGKRFLVNSLPADQGSPPLEVIVNWPSLLGKS